MVINRIAFFVLLLSLLQVGCSTIQHISKTDVRYEVVGSGPDIAPDAEIKQMIAPYKIQLDDKMNEVVANLAHELTKKKPESTLGNWYTDAMMAIAKNKGFDADFAISNYGGLRIPQITAGPLTRGEIYELCPFDNLMVIVEVPGDILDSLLQQIASLEGWPISSGVWMVIEDHRMIQFTLHGMPLDPFATYKVAMPDYVANGGDGLKVIIPLPRVQTGMLVRDILIEHAMETAKTGKEITARIEGRIVIQN